MKLVVGLLVMLVSVTGWAQEDDCDPSISHNVMFQSDREEFGPRCMQYAINRSMSLDYNSALVLDDGTQLPAYLAEPADSPLPGGAWNVVIAATYGWEGAKDGQIRYYKRPGSIMNLGPMVNMEFYTLEADTLIKPADPEKLTKTIRDEFDKFDDLDVTADKFYEDGKLYLKVTGNVLFAGNEMTASDLGERIAYFFVTLGWNYNYYLKWEELETKKKLMKNKQSTWNKPQFAYVMQLEGYEAKDDKSAGGRWNWSQNEGTKSVQLDNFGTTCVVSIQVKNTSDANRQKVVDELNKWVAKKKPSKSESAEVKVFGKTPWVEVKIPIGGMDGEDVYDLVYEDIIKDWGNDFVDEAQDVVKSAK